MWTCTKCGRIFQKVNQPHTCRKIRLEDHFKNKEIAKELFDNLIDKINSYIAKCKIISIPCCIHLFGNYDFLAILPKKDRLETRFALDRKLDNPRVKTCVQLSSITYKNCIDLKSSEDIDKELLGWLYESYHLKD
jgi:hypothetical protein